MSPSAGNKVRSLFRRLALAATLLLTLPCVLTAAEPPQVISTEEAVLHEAPGPNGEEIIVFVNLNELPKSDYFVFMKDGNFLIRKTDLKEMGFQSTPGVTVTISGDEYVMLGTMEGVEYEFNENTLTLKITASPVYLPKNIRSLRHGRRHGVIYPSHSSMHLNYGLAYSDGDSYDSAETNFSNELVIRRGNGVFANESLYSQGGQGGQGEENSSFIRLMTSLTIDKREDLRRVVVGDFITPASEFAGSVNLGGVSVSKSYGMNPYYIDHPTLSIKGYATSPSTIEVINNGMSVYRERIEPGEFVLTDIYPQNGSNDVDLVITDSLGNERKISMHEYLSADLLKSGLHEYSYSLGKKREGYGTLQSTYGEAMLNAWHRYGSHDKLTVGYMAGLASKKQNIGGIGSYVTNEYGISDLALLVSKDSVIGETGYGASAKQTYFGRKHRLWGSLKTYTKGYSLNTSAETVEDKYVLGAGTGFIVNSVGSIAASYYYMVKHEKENASLMSATLSKSLTRRLNFMVRLSRRSGGTDESAIYTSVLYNFMDNMSALATHDDSGSTSIDTLQVERALPQGEGYGYKLAYVKENRDSGESSTSIVPDVRLNGKYGTYRAQYTATSHSSGNSENNYTASAAGSVVFIGKKVGFSRPISDSFALVTVGDLEDVPVEVNSIKAGKTNRRGYMVAPMLNSFVDNHIKIDSLGIPMDYSVEEFQKFVSPPYRSGTIVAFETLRFQGFTGVLEIETTEGNKPVEFVNARILSEDRAISMFVGTDGEFYFENAAPGVYRVELYHEGVQRTFSMKVPESDEPFVELGVIVINEGTAPDEDGPGEDVGQESESKEEPEDSQ